MNSLTSLGRGLDGTLGVVTQFIWILQLALIIHVYRTGRPYWWTFVLFSAPLIGGLAYFFVEIMPGLNAPDGRGFLQSLKPRKWRIAELQAVLEETDTVVNRLALAEELAAGDQAQAAHDVAADCLQGVFQNDPHTLVAVARYKLGVSRHQEALALLDRVNSERDRMLALKVGLLKGDCLLGLARYDEAESSYRSIEEKFIGDAPRFGIAAVMEHTGRAAEAAKIWTEIRVKFRKASPAWRRSEKKWYRLATGKLNTRKKAPLHDPAHAARISPTNP